MLITALAVCNIVITPTAIALWDMTLFQRALLSAMPVVVLHAILIAAWLFLRQPPRVPSGTTGILLAPRVDPDSEPLLYRLSDEIRRDLKARGLHQLLVILMPVHLIPESDNEERALLQRSGGRLLVTGNSDPVGFKERRSPASEVLTFA